MATNVEDPEPNLGGGDTSDEIAGGDGLDTGESVAGSGGGDETRYHYENNVSRFGEFKTVTGAHVGGNGASADQSFDSEGGAEQQHIPLDEAAQALLEELKSEIPKLDPAIHKQSIRLIKLEMERISQCLEPEYLEVDVPKPIRIVRKIMVPVHRNPRFNFVGKLLGPGGKTLQNLIHSTRCRIYILGRGSSRERTKEDELLASGDPKFAHLKDPLYVRVEASGPAAMAYQKIAHVLTELQYYLQPVKDDIYLQQMADMGKPVLMPPPGGPPMRGGMRGSLMGTAPPMRGGMPPRGHPRGGPAPRGRGYLIQTPPPGQAPPPPAAAPSGPPSTYVTYPGYDYSGYGEYQQPAAQPPPPQTQPPAPHYGSVQAPPTHGPPLPPVPPPTGAPPVPPQAQPTSTTYTSAANPYNYPYGYDYSQYQYSTQTPAAQPPPPRPPGPAISMPPGGGKAPTAIGRGRGIPRPSPY